MAKSITINDMRAIATDLGGRCLSKDYVNSTEHLAWMCKRGHTWDMPYYVVRQGGWCSQCLKHEAYEEKFNEIKKVAKKNGFICLSGSYEGSNFKLNFQCKNGHKFLKTHKDFTARPLCYDCYRDEERQHGFNKMLSIAQERKGKFLSKKYIGSDKRHEWQCHLGHKWNSTPANIEAGRWCPVCAKEVVDKKQREDSFAKLKKFAQSHGGKILTKAYLNQNEEIKWQCKEGHKWLSTAANVSRAKSWCPYCSNIFRTRASLSDFKKMAKDNGGRLLSENYKNVQTNLTFQCGHGHIWTTKAFNIQQGHWCRLCYIERHRLSIDVFQKLAESKGGKLLTKEYVDSNSHLEWKCAKGHVWKAFASSVKAGNWCRKCFNDTQKSSIEEIQNIAKSRGGKLLSKKYVNGVTKSKWQCENGHVWMATPSHVKAGSWCPTCGKEQARISKRISIKKIQEHAIKMGGKFLSKEYTRSTIPVKWQCHEGHTWMASVSSVLNKGSWCNKCNTNAKKTSIEEIQAIAKKNKGILLSKIYVNYTAPLKWRCEKGHALTRSLKSVKKGAWCRICN